MESQAGTHDFALARLRRAWLQYTIGSLLFLLLGIAFLSLTWQPVYAWLWALLPALAMTYQAETLRRNLTANHRAGETVLLSELGWGNRLTLLRGLFAAGMMGFLLLPRPPGSLAWLPGILYVLSDAADFFDGYVARVTHHATHLGEILDLSFDGLGVLAASLLLVQYGQVPPWYLLVGAARYLFVLGQALRTRLGRSNYPLPPSRARRVFAGLQMGFLGAVLLPVFTPPGTWIAAALFGAPLLVGFARDWLSVSGVLRPGSASSRLVQLERWLPTLLRAAVPALAFGVGAFFVDSGLSAVSPWLTLLYIFHLLLLTLVFLGVLPRISAIAGLCALGFYQLFASLTLAQIALAVIYTLILYLGGGGWSLYTPEETLFHRPAGAPRTRPDEAKP